MKKKDLNKKLPISFPELEDLVNRVHLRYNNLSKLEIILIIKSFFEIVRFNIYLNNSITIKNIFSNLFLLKSKRVIKNKKSDIYKISLRTPKDFK